MVGQSNDARLSMIENSPAVAHSDFVHRYSTVPTIIETEGVRLRDQKGYTYLDLEAANGTTAFGYDATILQKAIRRIEGIPSAPTFMETELRLNVAERLRSIVLRETGMSGRIAFELGGAQGIEMALLVVRSHTKASQVVVFEGGYHGRSPFTAQLSASHRYRLTVANGGLPVVRLPFPDCEQCRFSQERSTCHLECVSFVEQLATKEIAGFAMEGLPQDVAAFVFEPLLNVGGMVMPDSSYLRAAVDTFRGLGALIVVDETFCGFHRTGPMFGFSNFGIEPDIIVLGKALTNGATPLSAVWIKSELADERTLKPGTHSSTFSNNVLGLSIASEVLDRFDSWNKPEDDIKDLESSIARILENIKRQSGIVRSTNAVGATGRLLLKKPVAALVADRARTVGYERPVKGLAGLLVAASGMAPNVLAISPALTISRRDLDAGADLLLRAISQSTPRASSDDDQ